MPPKQRRHARCNTGSFFFVLFPAWLHAWRTYARAFVLNNMRARHGTTGVRRTSWLICAGPSSLVVKKCPHLLFECSSRNRGSCARVSGIDKTLVAAAWCCCSPQISIPGAKRIRVVFDEKCSTEMGCDFVRIYKGEVAVLALPRNHRA